MSAFNENLEKIKNTAKDTVDKVQNSEIVEKTKKSASDVVDKINQNELVDNAKSTIKSQIAKNKYAKIGVIVLAILLVFGVIKGISKITLDTSGAKEALEYYINHTNSMSPEGHQYDDLSIKTLDSYRDKFEKTKKSTQVFIFDVEYTNDGGKELKYIYGVYKKEDDSFMCSIAASYGEGSDRTRKECIESVKKSIDTVLK